MRPPVRHGDNPSVFARPCTASRSFSSGAHDGSSSSSNEEDEDDNDDGGEDADLPSDAASLEDELARVQETIQRLEEGTDDDFVLGCEMLLASKQSHVTRAYANFERFKSTAIQLYEYECEQAKVRYHARCAQLQNEMREEFEREIQRLKNTRDGVSVMDRRRLTRNSGGGMDEKGKSRQGTSSSTASSELHPAAGNNGSGNPHNAFSAAEEAHRVQYEEKKRLEVLLSKTPVFQQLNQRVNSEDVSQDLAAITQAVQTRRRVCHQSYSATDAASVVTKEGSASMVVASHGSKDDRCRSYNGARRLVYNPAMLQEGDNVVVYRVQKCLSNGDGQETKQSRPEDEDSADEELSSSKEQVMSGVITASTSTHVFLLQPNGKFDTIEVSDWKANRIQIHAVSTKRKR
uniref:Uncharacterized protein n=1 Tax=Globisporangium ultimum (strain ATCC 200006 / CBS 805.95 / DAOM BR144) TaxID=431595 RepID=K3X3N3_GLOUD